MFDTERTALRRGVNQSLMRWLAFVPDKSTLLVLFGAAKRRLAEQTDGVANLSNERIDSATEELNQIADDIREA